jgi:hypothetical protein
MNTKAYEITLVNGGQHQCTFGYLYFMVFLNFKE